LALGRLTLVGRATELLARLEKSSDQDRRVLTLALGGLASHTQDPQVAARLEKMLESAQGAERDSLLELLGRVPTPAAVSALARVVERSRLAADRAKFAEALAAHPAERARLIPLLADASAPVRANAAWSLGEVGVATDAAPLERALGDADSNVAGNALEALARIAARNKSHVAAQACPRIAEPRPLLRALALRALRVTGERCEHAEELNALSRDRSDFVRQSAAALLRDVPRGRRDSEALARARDRDPSGAVATECEAPSPAPPDSVDPTVIVVIPAGADVPEPAQPFALLRADGLVRLGVSDRRGQLFEVAAPHGQLSLVDAASVFE
ncbi:MAG TPA: HEAT repeat domain-containing protein, partial [Polyangiaceae bacterium]|nr:HEAT repeat domain-containing protein [Polyangiaceae bacterium]